MRPSLQLALAALIVSFGSAMLPGAFGGASGRARAQNTVTAVMTADRAQVAVGETLRLQIRADVQGGEVEQFEPPDLSAFDILSQQISRPMQFRFGFGQQQQVVHATTIHTYVLRARSAGRYELPAATVVVDGRTHRTNALTLVVGGSGGAAPPAGQVPGQSPPGAHGNAPTTGADGAAYDPQAFIRTVVDQPSPYVGQQITVSVYLYTARALRNAPQIIQEPTADGFWVHDLLPPSRNLTPTRQVVEGSSFQVYEIRRFAAFPLRSGELQIGAPKMAIETGSLFDFFNPQQQRLERTGVPLAVKVQPLPSPAPAGDVFVGSLRLDASVDRDQVRTGDAITLSLRVEGVGNLRDVRPELPAVEGLRILAPQVEDEITQDGDRVGGTRTLEWLVIPEQPGRHTLPSIEVPTFDPTAARYGTARSEPIVIQAAGAAVASPVDDAEAVAPSATAGNPPTFGPIRRQSELRRASAAVSSHVAWWGAVLAAPLLFILFFGVRRLRRRAAANPAQIAAKDARRRLSEARKRMENDEPTLFYASVARAIVGAAEARLGGESIGGVTQRQMRALLERRGMSPELVGRLQSELEQCDFARFSSAGSERSEMEACMGRANTLLADLDRFVPSREAA